jgi:hypothetical protein
MPRVHRTTEPAGTLVEHMCRGTDGRPALGMAPSDSRCVKCDTYIVYVFDNTPKEKKR